MSNKTPNKKIAISILLCMSFFLSFVTAQENLGVFRQGQTINLIQTCSTCSYVTLDSVKLPNGTILIFNQNMTKQASTFSFRFNRTELLGDYIYNTFYDDWTAPVSFLVTLNGKRPAEGILIVVFSLIFIAIISFGIISLLKSLAHVLELEMDIIDAGVMVSTYLAMWIFYYFAFEYLANNVVNQLLETALSVGAITHVFLPIVGFLVSFIMTNLKFKQKARITY